MLSEDDMEDWAQPTQIFYGLHIATMVDRMAVCVCGRYGNNGSFVGTRDKNHYITLDFFCLFVAE